MSEPCLGVWHHPSWRNCFLSYFLPLLSPNIISSLQKAWPPILHGFIIPSLCFPGEKNDSADFILIFHFFWGLTLDSKEKRRGGVQQCFGMTVPDSWSRRTSTHEKKNWVWMLEPLTKSEQKGGNKSKNNLCHPRFRCFFLNICLLIPTTNLCNNCHYSHSSLLESCGIVPHLPKLFHHCSVFHSLCWTTCPDPTDAFFCSFSLLLGKLLFIIQIPD